MAFSDWKTTPALNVTISGINIDEGCPPANLNDAIRQLIADLKTWTNAPVVSGDYTGTGTVNCSRLQIDTFYGAYLSGGNPYFVFDSNDYFVYDRATNGLLFRIGGVDRFQVVAGGALVSGNYIWHTGNDGSGSGLDADLLDGYDSASFNRIVEYNTSENGGFIVYATGFVDAWGYVDVGQDTSGSVTFPTRGGGGALFNSWVNVTLGNTIRVGINEAENTGFSGNPTTSGFTIYNAQNQTIRVWWQAHGI